MITVIITSIVFTILIFLLTRKKDIEFGGSGVGFCLVIGALIGLLISVALPNSTVEEVRQVEDYIIRENSDNSKNYYVMKDEDC